MTKKVNNETTNQKRDLNQLLIQTSKKMFIPNPMKPNSFPNKLYNHIINIYKENNLYVDHSSLNVLINLTRATKMYYNAYNLELQRIKYQNYFFMTSLHTRIEIESLKTSLGLVRIHC